MKHRIDANREFSRALSTIQNPISMPFMHTHLDHELYYLMQGETCYFIGNKVFQVLDGAFVFIPRGVLHKTQFLSSKISDRILLQAEFEFFSSKQLTNVVNILSKRPVQYVKEDNIELIKEIFEKIENIVPIKTEHQNTLYNLYVAEILILLCEYGITEPTSDNGIEDALISSVQKYIGENYSKPITLSQMSEYFSVSEEHLSRKFKQKTGICISEFINYQRISYAADILKNEHISVTEVAERCGFNDSNYFSTVFKKVMGISPKQFSMQQKQNSN